MQDSAPRAEDLLSEEDLSVIHALQLRPRASWTELGRVLGVDPVTVARRWGRLTERGEAWVSISPGPRLFDRVCIAYLDIDCQAEQAGAVAKALGAHPHMLTIERSAAGRDLLATVATRDLPTMSRYTLDLLPAVPGITALRTRLVTHMFTEGGFWRIAALAPGQRARLSAQPGPWAADGAAEEVTALDRAVLGRLTVDGRASHRALAAGLAGPATVKRRLDRLTRLGLMRLRCDFARPLGGWPVAATFWARVPPAQLPDVGHALVRLPEVRNCAAVTGPHNLLVQANLHAVSDVLGFETRLSAAHPGIEVTEREITLRHDKLLGHLLDPHGRSVGVVAPDVWAEPAGCVG
ncbi:MAG TPA: Lrp/AsnC family transcriptional regulator [Actinocrinis sp.]|nr:Lrp/AsnC family transcriptional regulator [Actinocrinis sp.]